MNDNSPIPLPASDLPPSFIELTERKGVRFEEVAEIRDRDGVLAVITERTDDGKISFGLFREFEKDGKTLRSAYAAQRHIDGMRRLLNELERRLPQMEDRARAARRIAR